MDVDLAAFRLHALASLTSGRSSGAGARPAGGADFLDVLLQARGALQPRVAASAGVEGLLAGESSRVDALLNRLEASNRAFLQRYNARVTQIGDEAQVLGRLRERLAELGAASKLLEAMPAASGNPEVKAALRDFITRYNAWDAEFDPYFERGALLDGNQAGGVARFSLQREVGSIFHGAGNGGFAKGLTDMGVKIMADGQLGLDEAAFDEALAANRAGVLTSLDNMARAFREAAELLASDGHLLDRRIDNASRAVVWADDNQARLEAEFGPRTL